MRMATSSSTRRGRQSGADLKPPQAAVVKSDGGERCGKAGTRFRQARLREASASEPLRKCRNRIRCLIPVFDGAVFSTEWKEALWDRFFTAAPRRQRRSVERYNIVKRA